MAVTAAYWVMAAFTAYGIYEQGEQGRKAESARNKAREEQKKIQSEQTAQNAAQQAAERRTQIREERVRRGRILASSAAGGGIGGSSEAGATGALGTNLNVGLGANVGKSAAGERIGTYAENAATFMGQSQQAAFNAQEAARMASISGSIFSQTGGMEEAKSLFKTTPSTGTNIEGGQ